VNLEIIERVSKLPILPRIAQVFSLRKQSPTILAYRLRDLEGQISQGRGLLDSGGSLNPQQLSAQLTVLNEQRASLIRAQADYNLE